MKYLKIFGLCLVSVWLIIGSFILPAVSGDVKTDIIGHTYAVNINDTVYKISFAQGPFSPGPMGTASLISEDNVIGIYNFTSSGDMIIIHDLGNFFYSNYQLVYVPGVTTLLLKCNDCTE